MGKANDSIKYNKSYPEFNGLGEGMIKHKERSGAKAAALIPATTFVASATAAVLLLLLALSRIALVRPKLIESTFNSAQVEIRTDLEGSEEAYPLVYLLMPYAVGRENPVTPGGRLRLTDEEVEALGEAVLRGEIFSEKELLLFQNLSNRTDYLMLFRSKDENGDWELRKEALFIPMMRQGTEKPTPVPDDGTPKGPIAISMTPVPGTPTPPADKKTPTPVPDGTATPTPEGSATPTPTPTATPTPTPTPTPVPAVPVVPHGITIRIIGGGQGFAGTDPEHLSSASELQANPGETVYIKGVPEDTDDVHYLFARYEVTSGTVSNWTSSSFVMGNTDVELTFTFVRAYRLSIVNEMPAWGTATYQGGYQDFPAGESVSIHCEPSTHYEFVVAYDETEHYYFTDPDFTFPMPEQDLTLFVMFDKILVGLTIEPASGGSCSYSPDAEMEVGNTYYFQEGSTVTIAATGVIEDHVFAGYYVNGSSTLITDDPLTLTMDADTTVTPVFSQLYTIRIANNAPAYGTVTCNGTTLNGTTPSMTVKAAEGETITFQASPVAGSEISGVMVSPEGAGTLASAGGTYTYTVGDQSASILVTFAPRAGHAINISVDPAGSGSYTFASTPAYPPTNFPADAEFTVTATPAAGYRFLRMEVNGGSGGGTIADSSATFTMPEADVNIVLYFEEIPKYGIWVEVDPEEVEDIYVSGTGVETTSDGYLAPEGTVITLSHSDTNSDFAFEYYTVNGTAITGNTFTLNEDTEVVAVFRSLWHNIDVATDPADIGTVIVTSSDPDALNDYGGFYDCLEGTTVTFEASLLDDYEDWYGFVGFRVNGTLITGNTYTVNDDITVTAVFKSLWHQVYVDTDPTGIGADVEVDGTDVFYADGFYLCPDGDTITLSVPSGDWEGEYRFVGYRIGGTLITGNTYTVTSDITVTAVFESKYHDMFITSEGGANYVSPTYWPDMEEDESLTITWAPSEGYQFSHWTVTGAKSYTLNGDNSGGTVVMGNQDVYVVVYFEMMPGYHNIDVEPENYSYGSTSLSKYIAQVGETVTVTANPYTGYHFVRMVIDGVTYTDASVTIVMPDHDVTGTVYFEPD